MCPLNSSLGVWANQRSNSLWGVLDI